MPRAATVACIDPAPAGARTVLSLAGTRERLAAGDRRDWCMRRSAEGQCCHRWDRLHLRKA